MGVVAYEDMEFTDNDDAVRMTFMENYYADIPKANLSTIGKWVLSEEGIDFDMDEDDAYDAFEPLLAVALQNLTNATTKRPTTYIHESSGIPLIGSTLFGIVDRGTEFLELKPITGCNINCLFCSVDEGLSSSRIHDFLIEPNFLVQETQKLVAYKKAHHDEQFPQQPFPGITIFINPNGEPTLYAKLPELIAGLKAIDGIKNITIITNGLVLTPEKIDVLIDAGLTMLNISLEAMDQKTAKIMAGTGIYDVEKVIATLRHAAGKLKIVIAPVLVAGVNLEQLKDVVRFAKDIGADIFIQNYLEHKRGRNKFETLTWEKFEQTLNAWEKELDVKLWAKDQTLQHTIELSKPFKRKEQVQVTIVAASSFPKSMIGVARDRTILVRGIDDNIGKKIKCEILHIKNNLFTARTL